MSPKLFTHRHMRNNPRPSLDHLGLPGPPVGDRSVSEPQSHCPVVAQPRRIRTKFVVSSDRSGRKPKTVITINKSYEPASKPAVGPVAKHDIYTTPRNCLAASETSSSRPRNVEHAVERSPVVATPMKATRVKHQQQSSLCFSAQDLSSLTAIDDESSLYEDAMESFGIETPASPISTLNGSLLPRSVNGSPSRLVWTSGSEEDSVYSVDTVVDDGLSPWGLPKIFGPLGEDDRIDYSDAADIVDIEDTSSHVVHDPSVPGLKLKQPLPQVAVQDIGVPVDSSVQARKTVPYFIRLVLNHRLRQRAAVEQSGSAVIDHSSRKSSGKMTLASVAAAVTSTSASFFARFGSWI